MIDFDSGFTHCNSTKPSFRSANWDVSKPDVALKLYGLWLPGGTEILKGHTFRAFTVRLLALNLIFLLNSGRAQTTSPLFLQDDSETSFTLQQDLYTDTVSSTSEDQTAESSNEDAILLDSTGAGGLSMEQQALIDDGSASSSPQDPVLFPFSTNPVASWTNPGLSSSSVTLRTAEAETSMSIQRSGEYREYIQQQLAQHNATTDTLRGRLLLQSGVNHMLNREYDAALADLEPIIDGSSAATRADRIGAMNRAAWITHKHGNLVRAYQAFKEIERCTGSDAVRGQCRVERAALLFEMAKGEGRQALPKPDRPLAFQRAREICDLVTSTSEDVYTSTRMTAELMHFETYHFQGNYQQSYRDGKIFLAHWADRYEQTTSSEERQRINAALYFQLPNCVLTSHTAEAIVLARQVLAHIPAPDDELPGASTALYAAAAGRIAANEVGNQSAVLEFDRQGTAIDEPFYRNIVATLSALRLKTIDSHTEGSNAP